VRSGRIGSVTWPAEQPVLDGQIVVRPVRSADADVVHRACQDPDIQHFTQVPVPYSHDDAEAFVRLCQQWWEAGETANFAVCDRATGEFLGIVGAIGADHAAGTAGVGYWTSAWGRGRGATSEAVRLVVAWAFDAGGMTTLTAEAELANPASMRVLDQAGFVRCEGADEVIELKGTPRTFSIWRATAPSPGGGVGGPG
jgi:RimJ/RimL family protein N-acetyltransferase